MNSRKAICYICGNSDLVPCHESQVDVDWPNYVCTKCDEDQAKEAIVKLDDTNYGERLEDGFVLMSLAGDDNED